MLADGGVQGPLIHPLGGQLAAQLMEAHCAVLGHQRIGRFDGIDLLADIGGQAGVIAAGCRGRLGRWAILARCSGRLAWCAATPLSWPVGQAISSKKRQARRRRSRNHAGLCRWLGKRLNAQPDSRLALVKVIV